MGGGEGEEEAPAPPKYDKVVRESCEHIEANYRILPQFGKKTRCIITKKASMFQTPNA